MKYKRSMNVVFVCAFYFALAMFFIVISNSLITKEAVADQRTVNSYVEAKAYLNQVKAEYDACINQANAVYAQIEETTTLAFDAQKKLAESRLYLGDLAKYEYTNSTQFSIIMTVVCSDSLEGFFKNLDYANSVMDYQYRLCQDQMKRQADFNSVLTDLNNQTSLQNEYLTQASGKLAEASDVLNDAKSKLTPEELAELEGEISDIGGGEDPGGGGDDPGPAPPGPGPNWSTGIASAYGGSSDPHTPNPGTTATGEVCDDWSTGVAIPMAWPNYKQYFHHTVQIKWNGITVLAKINDCGGMGGGSRSLDLQPGVFKAFGFQTCQAWGLRQVDYLIM